MSAECPPRLSRLHDKLQKRSGWLGKLLRFSDGETGGGEMSGNGNGKPEDKNDPALFAVPEPSRIFGSYAGRIRMNPNPPHKPSQAEIKNRPLLNEAAAIEDPWASDEPPPLYSSRSTRK